MKVDATTLERIAHLSRLYLAPEDEAQVLKNLNNIVEWVSQLEQLDTEGVEPLTHMTAEQNVLRPDETGEPLPHERGLKHAPRKDSDYFRVPRVME